ncbi:MAG: type II secretion system F family protein [Pirellulales bacterium]|nr:type II secretion system F family protein [Pirellulales bacterium]
MPDDRPPALPADEARLLAEQLAILAQTGLPLASGLRAAAEEMPSPRLAEAMNSLAQRLEQGRSLDDVLRDSPRLLPEHMLRLIETGVRSGNLADVLSQLVEIDRSSHDLRRSVRGAIAYPLLLALLCAVLLVLLATFILPALRQVVEEFEISDLPFSSAVLFSLDGKKLWLILAAALTAVTMIFFALRVSLPPQRWRWMLT